MDGRWKSVYMESNKGLVTMQVQTVVSSGTPIIALDPWRRPSSLRPSTTDSRDRAFRFAVLSRDLVECAACSVRVGSERGSASRSYPSTAAYACATWLAVLESTRGLFLLSHSETQKIGKGADCTSMTEFRWVMLTEATFRLRREATARSGSRLRRYGLKDPR